jgi:hypothetical protein
MSNLSGKRKLNNSEQKSSGKGPIKAGQAKRNAEKSLVSTNTNKAKRWSFIQTDLSDALTAWEELEKTSGQLSPEEEQLVKIKSIIAQLSDKLNQF